MKAINTRLYIDTLRELTDAGKEVSLIVAGSSMAPFLVIIGTRFTSVSLTVR